MLASVIISYFEVNILLNCWIIGRKIKGNKEKGNIINNISVFESELLLLMIIYLLRWDSLNTGHNSLL